MMLKAWCQFLWSVAMLTGLSTQFSNTTLCIGEEVVYNCSVNSFSHIWSILAFDIKDVSISEGLPMVSRPPFTMRLIANNGNSIVTSLSVVSFAGLNGTVITCGDALIPIGQGEVEETTIMVAGPPSAPGLTAVAIDLHSFNFTIFPLSEPSQCVLHYNITPISSDGNMLTDIIAVITDGRRTVTLNASGFNLCNNIYNFTVAAVTLNGTGERSAVVNPQPIDFLSPGVSVITTFGFHVTVTGMVPMNSNTFMNASVSIMHSFPDSGICEEETRLTSDSPTVTETLSCNFTGRVVTYCLQFRIKDCQSHIAMESTRLPGLITSITQDISSTTSNSITLLVRVNDHFNCKGMEQLYIRATVSNNTEVISLQEVNFTNVSIILDSIPPAEYTCYIFIMNGMETIENTSLPCRNSPEPGDLVNVNIAGGIVGGFIALLILVVVFVAIIVLVAKINQKKHEFKAPQYNLEDVKEKDNDKAFAVYATPNPEIVKMKAERRKMEQLNILKSPENPKPPQRNLEDVKDDDGDNSFAKPDHEIVKMKAERRKMEQLNILKSSEKQKPPQCNLEDVKEKVDNDEDNSFALYAKPNPEIVKMKAKRRKMEQLNILKSSENPQKTQNVKERVDNDDDNSFAKPNHEIVKMKAERRKLEQLNILKSSEIQKPPQCNLEDVKEKEDNSFALYAKPNPEIVKMKAERRKLEQLNALTSSENQKLLKDAYGDESPPKIPKKKSATNYKVPSRVPVGLHELTQKEGSKVSVRSDKVEAAKKKFPVLKPPVEKATTEFPQIKLEKLRDCKRAEYNHPQSETT